MKLRVYDSAVELYQALKPVALNRSIKDQLMRASMSVCLNIAEGNNRDGNKDRRRFFNIALTSLREVQAIIDMEQLEQHKDKADKIGAQLYCLHRKCI